MANPACVARFTQGLLLVDEEKLKNAANEVLFAAWRGASGRQMSPSATHSEVPVPAHQALCPWHHFCWGAAPFQDTLKSFLEAEEWRHVQTWETESGAVVGQISLYERNGTLCNWVPPHQEKMVFSIAHKEQLKKAFPPNSYFCKNAVSSKNKPGKKLCFSSQNQ